MSLFQDDFYSTKVSRWGRGKRGTYASTTRESNRLFWTVAVSVATGMVLAFGLMAMTGVFGGDDNSGRSGSGGATASIGGGSAAGRLSGGENPIIQAAAKARPMVVSVMSTFTDSASGSDKVAGMGVGSGVIFEKEKGKVRIVTNNHVVEGASSYEVVLTDGQRREAKVLGMDSISDLAVMEMDGTGIDSVAEFGDSDRLEVGETAISIGNPLGLNVAQTVTVGVISSPKVTIPVSQGQNGETEWEMDVIQTDAAINKGNSGGALVNLDGQVVGINSMKLSETGVEGIGFAIPINTVKPIIRELIDAHKVSRPFLGVTTVDLEGFTGAQEALKLPKDVKSGAVVLDTTGPAKDAGLKLNDVIVELDGKPIDGTLALRKFLYNEKKIGDKLKITYYRGGKKATASVTLVELKDK